MIAHLKCLYEFQREEPCLTGEALAEQPVLFIEQISDSFLKKQPDVKVFLLLHSHSGREETDSLTNEFVIKSKSYSLRQWYSLSSVQPK